MSRDHRQLRLGWPALLLSVMAAGCSAGTTPSQIASESPSPIPTASPTPSVAPALIPDGTYATAPMDVAAVNALVNADTKLTAAEKNFILEDAFELGLHKTFTVTLVFSHGQYTEHQGFDGAVGEVGSRATFAFPDDHTLVIEESCCGISTFDVTLTPNGFSLKVRSGDLVATEQDKVIGHILFESSPFTLVP
jgi:hypothetical protein